MFDKQSIPDCMVVVKTNGNKVTIVEVNELVKLTQSINTSPSARAVEESFQSFLQTNSCVIIFGNVLQYSSSVVSVIIALVNRSCRLLFRFFAIMFFVGH